MKGYNLKIIGVFSLNFVLAACSTTGSVSTIDGNQTKSAEFSYEYYDLKDVSIPADKYEFIKEGVLKAEEILLNAEFLKQIENKNDWTYQPNGMPIRGKDVVEVIRSMKNIRTSELVNPKLYFYTPPSWGWDECNGFSAVPFKRTSSTGCSNKNGINKNLLALGDSYHTFSEFYIHEWLHAAGFGHGGNSKQCSKEKRNSVPIYTGCVAEQLLRGNDVKQCSEAC